MDKDRTKAILAELDRLYPNPGSELSFQNPYELVVAVSLSAQCTDKKVNEVTETLFRKFPTFEALSKASIPSIEAIIRPVNYYRTKAKNINSMAKLVANELGGKLPMTHAGLTALPGVGNKTANVVLSELQIEPAFPVDTHVFRVSNRLRLVTGDNVKVVEEKVKKKFDPLIWRPLHHWLIFHGRRVCKAQRPLCEICTLNPLCPSRQTKLPKVKDIKKS